MVEGVSFRRLSETIEEEDGEAYSKSFEARVRYMASSQIVTIPVKIVRELGLELGDRVIIRIMKKETPLRADIVRRLEEDVRPKTVLK